MTLLNTFLWFRKVSVPQPPTTLRGTNFTWDWIGSAPFPIRPDFRFQNLIQNKTIFLPLRVLTVIFFYIRYFERLRVEVSLQYYVVCSYELMIDHLWMVVKGRHQIHLLDTVVYIATEKNCKYINTLQSRERQRSVCSFRFYLASLEC